MKFLKMFFLSLAVLFAPISVNVDVQAKQSEIKKTDTKKKKSKKAKKTKKKKVAKSSSARKAAPSASYNPKYAEFVVDSESGRIIHQESANERRYPASLTKMMTIYLAFEQLKAGNWSMNDNLRISAYAASMPKTNLSMYPGDTITVREAILGLIVHSANDASVVLAENIAGTEDKFAELMTRRAKQLGMKSTRFKNASGLHDPGQVTTAKDMALLGIALKRHFSDYYYLFSRTYFSYNGRTYNSHNRVTRDYEGADGLKTGYVRASGFNLVTSASRSEGSLVGVVLGGRSAATRDQRMKDMLDESFERLEQIKRSGKYQVNNDNTKILFQEFSEAEDAANQNEAKELALNNQDLEPASGSFVPYPKAKPKFLGHIN